MLLTVRPLETDGTWQYKTQKNTSASGMGKKKALLPPNLKMLRQRVGKAISL
ncbi:MAG: hypothetical protein ACLSD7_01240 [Coprococcus phoceensis]